MKQIPVLWLIIPHLIALIILTIILLRFYVCYKKRQRLNTHLSVYINTVNDIKKPLETLYDPLNEISFNSKLDDIQKDKIRLLLWKINTIQKSLKSIDEIEQDEEWKKNLKKINKDCCGENNYEAAENLDIDSIFNSGLSKSDQQYLEKVFGIIRENYQDTEFNVDILSQKMGMSRSSFYNRIKAISGQAPADFIRQYRMERAKEMLKQNTYTIAEVAYKCGFSDVKYFRDVFKKKYHKSPGQYSKIG